MLETREAVQYEEIARGPEHCAVCEHWLGMNRCTKVVGAVYPEGWCIRFDQADYPHRRPG